VQKLKPGPLFFLLFFLFSVTDFYCSRCRFAILCSNQDKPALSEAARWPHDFQAGKEQLLGAEQHMFDFHLLHPLL